MAMTPGAAAVAYAQGVADEEIVACVPMRQQAVRWLKTISGKADYRPGVLDEFYEWTAENFIFVNGPKEGETFLLAPYQLWVMGMMLATYVSKHPKAGLLYRELLWITGKGTAKTSTSAVAMIAHMYLDRYVRKGTTLPIICVDAAQSEAVPLKELGDLVDASNLTGMQNYLSKGGTVTKVRNHDTNTLCTAMTKETTRANVSGGNKRGIITSAALVDEYSNISNSDAIKQARAGQKAGPSPIFFLSNGGGFIGYPAHLHYDKARRMLDGVHEDERLCPVINMFDNPDNYKDELEWQKACPMLGISVPLSYYADATKEVENKPWELQEHLRLYGGQWVESTGGWIDMPQWDEIEDPDLTIEDFKGKALYTAEDLAKSGDLCAYVAFAEDGVDDQGREKWMGFLRAFTGQGSKGIPHKAELDGIQYEYLAQDGYINIGREQLIDYKDIANQYATDISEAPAVVRCYDTQFKGQLREAEEGIVPQDIPEIAHPQHGDANINKPEYLNMGRSIGYAEDLITQKRLRFVHNPLMRIALNAAHITSTSKDSRYFARSTVAKYDPAVALAMVCGLVHLPFARDAIKPRGPTIFAGKDSNELMDIIYGE